MKAFYSVLFVLLLNSVVCNAETVTVPFGTHFVGNAIKDETGESRHTCVRVEQDGKIAWFGSETYQSYQPGIIAEVAVGELLGVEGVDGDAKYFKQSCQTINFKTGKPSPNYKTGNYKAIFRIKGERKLFIVDAESVSEKNVFFLSVKLSPEE